MFFLSDRCRVVHHSEIEVCAPRAACVPSTHSVALLAGLFLGAVYTICTRACGGILEHASYEEITCLPYVD